MKDLDIQLWAGDEVHFHRHTTLTRMWAPKGNQPQDGLPADQKGFYIQRQYLLHYPLQHTQGKILLILDNATWHKARDLKTFFVKNQHRLVRIFLPSYSPELNPIERVGELPDER